MISRTVAALRSGAWLSADRIRRIAYVLGAGYAGAWAYLLSGPGHLDPRGRAVGTDFAAFYGAARALLRGVPAASLYSPETLNGSVADLTAGAPYVWVYPPTAFLPYLAVGALPYLWALAAWLAAGLAVYLAVVWRVLPGRAAVAAALLFPAVFATSTHGHNGLLLGACLGGSLLLLRRSPLVAGALLGLATIKPHLGLLFPVALMVGGHWRMTLGAVLSSLGLAALATVLLGADVWPAFLRSSEIARAMLETEGVSYAKITSVFGAVRLAGGGVVVGYVAQGLAFSIALVAVVRVWRSDTSDDVRAAVLLVAGTLATPYVCDYDLVTLGVGLAFWVREARGGWLPWEKTAVFLLWLTPLLARPVAQTFSLGALPLVAAVSLALLSRRARSTAEVARWSAA
jgi:hypothetical protein